MITWAREYRFYRNYHRMVGYQFFMRNSYLAANVFLALRRAYRIDSDRIPLQLTQAWIIRVIAFYKHWLGPTRLSLLLVFPAPQ